MLRKIKFLPCSLKLFQNIISSTNARLFEILYVTVTDLVETLDLTRKNKYDYQIMRYLFQFSAK